jgi:hypothetical protein
MLVWLGTSVTVAYLPEDEFRCMELRDGRGDERGWKDLEKLVVAKKNICVDKD